MTKSGLILFFSLMFFFNNYAQDIVEIDSLFEIKHNEFHKKELRVYKLESLTRNHSMRRIYLDKDSKWKIESYYLYEELAEIKYYNENEISNDSLELETLEPKVYSKLNTLPEKNFEEKWLELITTNILEVPKFSEYEYKLRKKSIEKTEGKFEIEEIVVGITDGTGYYIKINNDTKSNAFYIHEPFFYFKEFPKVDELNYIVNFLKLLDNIYVTKTIPYHQ